MFGFSLPTHRQVKKMRTLCSVFLYQQGFLVKENLASRPPGQEKPNTSFFLASAPFFLFWRHKNDEMVTFYAFAPHAALLFWRHLQECKIGDGLPMFGLFGHRATMFRFFLPSLCPFCILCSAYFAKVLGFLLPSVQ